LANVLQCEVAIFDIPEQALANGLKSSKIGVLKDNKKLFFSPSCDEILLP